MYLMILGSSCFTYSHFTYFPFNLFPILPTSHFACFPFCLLPILPTSHLTCFPFCLLPILPTSHFAYSHFAELQETSKKSQTCLKTHCLCLVVWVRISADILKYFSYFSQKTGFDFSCKLYGDNFHDMSVPVFWGEKKISSSAELAESD